MTAAFSMGLPFTSRKTVTSMRAVDGGDLYLRPRLEVSCWAPAASDERTRPSAATKTLRRKRERRSMGTIVTGLTVPATAGEPMRTSSADQESIVIISERATLIFALAALDKVGVAPLSLAIGRREC